MQIWGTTRFRRRRGGALIIELFVASTLAGVAILLVTRSVGLWTAHQSYVEQERIACVELQNVLERLAAEEQPDENREYVLSSAAQQSLPGATVDLQTEIDGELLRLDVALDWQLQSGRRSRPARLVTWVYRPSLREEKP